jgi:hypothetical protein
MQQGVVKRGFTPLHGRNYVLKLREEIKVLPPLAVVEHRPSAMGVCRQFTATYVDLDHSGTLPLRDVSLNDANSDYHE